MTKTPEEKQDCVASQLADKYVEAEFKGNGGNVSRAVCKYDFMSGYQAAKDEYKVAIDTYNDVAKQMLQEAVRIMSPKDQLADASKVMPQWISVKERLPEEGVGWTTVYGCILSRWSVQPGFYDKDNNEWVSRFIGGYMDDEGYAPFEDVTHWQPPPEAPKDE